MSSHTPDDVGISAEEMKEKGYDLRTRLLLALRSRISYERLENWLFLQSEFIKGQLDIYLTVVEKHLLYPNNIPNVDIGTWSISLLCFVLAGIYGKNSIDIHFVRFIDRQLTSHIPGDFESLINGVDHMLTNSMLALQANERNQTDEEGLSEKGNKTAQDLEEDAVNCDESQILEHTSTIYDRTTPESDQNGLQSDDAFQDTDLIAEEMKEKGYDLRTRLLLALRSRVSDERLENWLFLQSEFIKGQLDIYLNVEEKHLLYPNNVPNVDIGTWSISLLCFALAGIYGKNSIDIHFVRFIDRQLTSLIPGDFESLINGVDHMLTISMLALQANEINHTDEEGLSEKGNKTAQDLEEDTVNCDESQMSEQTSTIYDRTTPESDQDGLLSDDAFQDTDIITEEMKVRRIEYDIRTRMLFTLRSCLSDEGLEAWLISQRQFIEEQMDINLLGVEKQLLYLNNLPNTVMYTWNIPLLCFVLAGIYGKNSINIHFVRFIDRQIPSLFPGHLETLLNRVDHMLTKSMLALQANERTDEEGLSEKGNDKAQGLEEEEVNCNEVQVLEKISTIYEHTTPESGQDGLLADDAFQYTDTMDEEGDETRQKYLFQNVCNEEKTEEDKKEILDSLNENEDDKEETVNDAEETYKHVLDRSISTIKECMNPEPILDSLLEDNVFQYIDIRDIMEKTSTTTKNETILETVRQNGNDVYKRFKQYLGKSHQNLLLQFIEKTEKGEETTDIRKDLKEETRRRLKGLKARAGNYIQICETLPKCYFA